MEFKIISLGEVSKFNQFNYNKSLNWDYINYLDTGNLTNNYIDEIKFIDIKNEKIPSRAKRIVKDNSILYSTVRPNQNHHGLIENNKIKNLIASTGFAVINPDTNIVNSRYLYYHLIQSIYTNKLQSIAETSTSTYPSITMDDLKELKIKLPTLKYQENIVKILTAFDEKILINDKIISNLETQAQVIFKSWFIDFEQFEDEEFVESEIGMIPKGWEVVELLDLIDFIGGSQPPKSEHIYEYKEGYVRFIQNRDYNLSNNHITYIKESRKNKYAKDKDILMDKYGEAGKVRYGIIGAYNVALAKIKPFNIEHREYIRRFLEQKSIQNYIFNSSIASTRPSVSKNTLTNLKMVLPDKKNLKIFSNISNNFIDMILNLRSQNKILSEIRDTILPKLMSGEIRLTLEDETENDN